MRLVSDGWSRRGLSLLWSAGALLERAEPAEVCSIREFFHLAREWPEALPSEGGDTLFVAGVEGCLDALAMADAEHWIEHTLRRGVLAFQEHYEGQAGLVLWIPGGRTRVHMRRATESYLWHCARPETQVLEIGRLLCGGAESDLRRILDPRERSQDPDGPAWIGLHHPRIS